MNKDLQELKEIDEKVKNKLSYIKSNLDIMSNNINEVKALKNDIYEKTSKAFIYNLKKLIQLESTQKNLANKIGISEDLLSKYKSGDAFPSIETLLYICEVYNIEIEKLISIPLTAVDIESLENDTGIEHNIFDERYYVYFFVTNIAKEGAIHEGVMEIHKENVSFKICSSGKVIKCFTGRFTISDKIIFFNLNSHNDGTTYINMIKPNVNKNKYVGGVAMMMLPSDANSKPCVQKILFSKVRLNRDEYYANLKEILSFNVEGANLGHIKISQWEDEAAYNFILKLS
ncbi:MULTISPECIES: helix-turn-helix transcriptional regulator [unclassified Clostridium]|uniref:helix-turn-helix domain-containing protein n=1 Tax=unclassified Clostridium TaxID=2614128 RepID=UPI0002976210|nr:MULTISPECIES: helix-turn-helix transcriptional regulator [unclassified Clostridium]EKQ57958.1 MAG: putative transcriptional regulator [Clostridium sp. Maddingley MBC34-26]